MALLTKSIDAKIDYLACELEKAPHSYSNPSVIRGRIGEDIENIHEDLPKLVKYLYLIELNSLEPKDEEGNQISLVKELRNMCDEVLRGSASEIMDDNDWLDHWLGWSEKREGLLIKALYLVNMTHPKALEDVPLSETKEFETPGEYMNFKQENETLRMKIYEDLRNLGYSNSTSTIGVAKYLKISTTSARRFLDTLVDLGLVKKLDDDVYTSYLERDEEK
jgi:hypothetical protein